MIKKVNIFAKMINYFLFIFLILNSPNVFSNNSTSLSFKGNLIDTPPCDIYGTEGINKPVNIQFSKIAIQRIDGKRFQKNWSLNIDCGANLGSNVSLELNYMGNPVLFDEKALETSRAGIGIRLYNATDSTVIAPNDKKKLTMTNNGRLQIPLYSIPVKIAKPITPIIEGKFTATATISINYP
ncbi:MULTISPECIES: fimbrial protein [Providencia]|nr:MULTISPECIES: fimbrial protein [Providencia]APC13662.1 hypothetical protein RB151_040150 [Providencia rettgeri]AVL73017.1 fimbrial protein [Providencia rettgeri]EJD6042134.1 fimbrial protein [Providencia rettgeri]EJD6498804.1 fimbrial protein [Providencia rettgeri]EJD6538550.1 fimbrial protein [Providencia rettgeri]